MDSKTHMFKVYLIKNGAFIGSCGVSERHKFIKFYMQSNKLKQAPRVEFKLVKK